jgi:hypothetical protein
MSTPSQIQSARVNGARSHGPVTPAGKQKSARNATRHGLLSNTVVLEGESKERFEELLASLTAELQPRNTTEAALVETMAVARWRYLRVLSIQKAQLDMEMAREAAASSGPVRAAIAFKRLSDNSRALDLLLRYEVAFDRQFSRALNILIKLRASANLSQTAENARNVRELPTAAGTHGHPGAGLPEPEILEFPNEPAPGLLDIRDVPDLNRADLLIRPCLHENLLPEHSFRPFAPFANGITDSPPKNISQ